MNLQVTSCVHLSTKWRCPPHFYLKSRQWQQLRSSRRSFLLSGGSSPSGELCESAVDVSTRRGWRLDVTWLLQLTRRLCLCDDVNSQRRWLLVTLANPLSLLIAPHSLFASWSFPPASPSLNDARCALDKFYWTTLLVWRVCLSVCPSVYVSVCLSVCVQWGSSSAGRLQTLHGAHQELCRVPEVRQETVRYATLRHATLRYVDCAVWCLKLVDRQTC